MKVHKRSGVLSQLDLPCIVVPLAVVLCLCAAFLVRPAESTALVDTVRTFLGEKLGFYYMILLFSFFCVTFYIALSKYGTIRLGNLEKPEYSDFKWAIMIFTGTFAADVIYYSFVEWAMNAADPGLASFGSVQDFANTFAMFHWGPIGWGLYIVLACAFGFMLHVRGRNRQKFSEACRPIIGDRADGPLGKLIDIITILVLLCGAATTFSITSPFLSAVLCRILGLPEQGPWLNALIMLSICGIYTFSVLYGVKGHLNSSNVCVWLLLFVVAWFLIFGGETSYILESGLNSVGVILQNFFKMSLWIDPQRTSGGFVQNWTIFYWAYWMTWCIATPFFIAVISRGRTIRNMIFGTYAYGLAGTFLGFIVFGGYSMSQQLKGVVDILGDCASGTELPTAVLAVFDTLPLPVPVLTVFLLALLTLYSTTFDSITFVVSAYSYQNMTPELNSAKAVRVFWAITFIILPVGLIFAGDVLTNLQGVAIIAAFPLGFILITVVAGFLRDAGAWLREQEEDRHA